MSQQLCKIFKQLGLTIFEATNGVEALEVLHKEKVDIVFTDIVMPVMDGFELCEEIRKSNHFFNLPIVVLSTHCDTNYIVKALRQGADDYIPKPAKAPIVKKVLTRVLKKVDLGISS
ncbi:hypothetical protein MNBD_UNCLBAC01-576 [hydrothermal vent metagenome]|uniref:Response regulatory domain-containing protein n=1 Tax=hydrothermal vent metagenome TaxID=652676 RepID=A0A3B1DGX4_9ZZZZ